MIAVSDVQMHVGGGDRDLDDIFPICDSDSRGRPLERPGSDYF
jgi:hypothetical protein